MRAFAVIAAAAVTVAAVPAWAAGTTTCTLDGKPWEVQQPISVIVATKPIFGTRLQIDVYGDRKTDLPYLQITAEWKRLKGKSNLTLKAKNAAPGGPLEAMWTEVGAKPAPAFGEPQPGVHYLERGELKLIKHDASAGTLTMKADFTMREGASDRAAKNTGNHKADVRCTFDAVPIKFY
jgi:hypothetical protein